MVIYKSMINKVVWNIKVLNKYPLMLSYLPMYLLISTMRKIEMIKIIIIIWAVIIWTRVYKMLYKILIIKVTIIVG